MRNKFIKLILTLTLVSSYAFSHTQNGNLRLDKQEHQDHQDPKNSSIKAWKVFLGLGLGAVLVSGLHSYIKTGNPSKALVAAMSLGWLFYCPCTGTIGPCKTQAFVGFAAAVMGVATALNLVHNQNRLHAHAQ
jgi:hypothetical protein